MKTKKVAKSKAVVGSAKKKKDGLFSKRNWQKKLYIGSASLLLVLSIGFTGVNYWQNKQLKAEAAGWTVIAGRTGAGQSAIVACKVAVNSAYGPLWLIRLAHANGSSGNSVARFYVERGSTLMSTTIMDARPGQWVSKQVYASRLLGDTYSVMFGLNGKGGGGPFSGMRSFSTITNC